MSETDFPLTAFAYISQLSTEAMIKSPIAICNSCFTPGSNTELKRCTGCKLVTYCSKKCQKRQWSKHRNFCNMAIGKGLKNAYLSGFTRDEVAQLVVDSYRQRVELDHATREQDHGIYYPGGSIDGLVWVKGDPITDFQRYLDLAEEAGILPNWWDFETRMEVLTKAVDTNNKANVSTKYTKGELLTRHGSDPSVAHALSILAELVVGHDGLGGPKDNQHFDELLEEMEMDPEEMAYMHATVAARSRVLREMQGRANDSRNQ